MSDLDLKEQGHVRVALLILRRRLGGWTALAQILRIHSKHVQKIVRGTSAVTATIAFRVARLLSVPVDELLSGKFAGAEVCRHCGRAPDFSDENTVVSVTTSSTGGQP